MSKQKQPITPIPENLTLTLTREQWLALRWTLTHDVVGGRDMRANCPFIYNTASDILELMGGYMEEALEDYKEYAAWYQTVSECDQCGDHFLKDQLIKFSEQDEKMEYCVECFEDAYDPSEFEEFEIKILSGEHLIKHD